MRPLAPRFFSQGHPGEALLRFTARRTLIPSEVYVAATLLDEYFVKKTGCEWADWPPGQRLPTWWSNKGYNPPGIRGGVCPICGSQFQWIRRAGRQRVYCNDACKMRAYRERVAERQTAFLKAAQLRFLAREYERPGLFDRVRDLLGLW